MKFGSKANSRRRTIQFFIATGFISTLSPFVMSNPVDELLPPLTTSNEAVDNMSNDERPELSLLSVLDLEQGANTALSPSISTIRQASRHQPTSKRR